MDNKLEVFENGEFGKIRVQIINNETWFIAKDICNVLKHTNSRKAISRLDEDEVTKVYITDSLGREQETSIINEMGLYSLILTSNIPTAKQFKKWITHEVLPSIRKHGAYLTDDKIEEVLTNPDTIIRLAMNLKEEKEKRKQLEFENIQKEQIIGELKPKADYLDIILQSQDTLTVTQIGADYGLSAKALNKILNEEGIQRFVNDQWILYTKYMNQGLTKSKTVEFFRRDGRQDYKLLTRWTQKGRVLIHKILEKRNIKANMDRELLGK